MKYDLGNRIDPVITYFDAKTHLVLSDDRQRANVLSLIQDATDLVEADIEGTIGTRTVSATFYEGESIRLPRGPVQNVNGITDAANNDVPYMWERYGNEDRILLTGNAKFPIVVSYSAGHDPVPGGLRRVILHHIATMFDSRLVEGDGQPQPWIERTLAAYRRSSPVQ